MILLLWRNKLLIATTAFGFALIAALVSFFLLTPQFESRAVIMEAKDSSASPGLRNLGESSPVGTFLMLGGPGQAIIKYQEILQSRQIASNVVDENELLSRLEVEIDREDPRGELKARDGLIRSLRGGIRIETEREVLRLSFRHPDPIVARDIVDFYLEALRQYIRSNLLTQARSTELFIEARLEEVEANLATVEAQYLEMKRDLGIVQLPSQINFALGTATNLRSQIIEKEMQIELYKNVMRDSSEVRRLTQEKEQLEAQLRRLIRGSGTSETDAEKMLELFTPLDESSELQFKFANAERLYKTQVSLIELLSRQLEVARIETKRSEPVFQLIDPPVEGLIPVAPNKRLNTVLGFLLGMILSTFLVLVLNQFSALPKGLTRIVRVDIREKDSPPTKRVHLN